MEFNVPDLSAASTDTSSATPADSTPSASVTEAPQSVSEPTADATQAYTDAVQVGEATTPSPAEPQVEEPDFPDDAAFQQLAGEERASNWQQLRSAYAEAKKTIAELQAQPPAPTFDEETQSKIGLADSLWSPVTDESGNVITDEMGLPQYTAEPFVEKLAEESPNTLAEVIWRGIDAPVSDSETFGHWLLKERFGLDPALLETYQQIRSPQDAVQYISAATGIDPAELEIIPNEYQDAYKSLTPELRAEVQAMTDAAREQYLAERQELLESRKFRDEQKAREAQAEQARQQQFQQQIHQRGEQLIEDVRNRSLQSAMDTLKQKANFSPEADVNTALHQEILAYAQQKVESDPMLQTDLQRCDQLYRLSVYHQATGDQWKATQAKTEADKLANKLTIKLNNFITERTGFWSKTFGGVRSTQQQQVQNAIPRVEIGANGNSSQPNAPAGAPQPPSGSRFGFSDNRISELTNLLQQAKQNQAYR